MTKWRAALSAAAAHIAAATEEAGSSGWLPICIAYRRVEEAEAALATVRAELDKTKAIQNWRDSGLIITLEPEAAR